ncbi:MAG: hypothetical protein H6727_10140 [Myxococcales bacterium]|nr:hypothetical protein [Myxococcales bacterium]
MFAAYETAIKQEAQDFVKRASFASLPYLSKKTWVCLLLSSLRIPTPDFRKTISLPLLNVQEAQMYDAFWLGLTFGGWLSLFMGSLIFLSLRQNPLIWINDAPPDVRKRVGPVDKKTKRQQKIWGLIMLSGVALLFGVLAWPLRHQSPWIVFFASYVCFQTFNLFDALVIDLGLVIFRPSWAFPKDLGDSPTYRDPRWHLKNWLTGVVMGVPFAFVVAVLCWIAARFLG